MISANDNLKIESDTSYYVSTQIYFLFNTVDTASLTL